MRLLWCSPFSQQNALMWIMRTTYVASSINPDVQDMHGMLA